MALRSYILHPRIISRNEHRFFLYCLFVGIIAGIPLDYVFPSSEMAEMSGSLEAANRIVPQCLRAFLFGIMIVYVVITGLNFGEYGFRLGKVLGVFAILIICYAIADPDRQKVTSNLYIATKYIYWIIGVVVFYRLTQFNYLNIKVLIKFARVTVIAASICSIYYIFFIAQRKWINADAYLLLFCIPILLLDTQSKMSLILVGLASAVILLTIKRGACLALLFSIISFFLTYAKNYGMKPKVSRWKVFIGIVLFVILLVIVGITSWDRIIVRMDDLGDADEIGSLRGTLYRLVFYRWLNADIINQVFGFGFDSVSSYTERYMFKGLYAHSDWLEVLHDFGIMGVCLLLWLHIEIICIIHKSHRQKSLVTPSLVMGYTIFLLSGLYAGILMFPTTIFFSFFLGYVCSVVEKNEQNKYTQQKQFV